MTQYRAVFDVRISFVNGGGLNAEGFRLDVPERDTSQTEVARLLVQHLGLAMVGEVVFDHFTIVEEQHKGTRGVSAPVRANPAAPMRLVDLSHTLREGLVTFPGVPAPSLAPHLRRGEGTYAPGTSFAMDIFTIPGNTGTYLDTAWHRYEGGADLAALDLATLVDLPTEVFHLADSTLRGIPASVFYDRDVAGKAVLLHTGWDRHFGTPEYGQPAPFLASDGVDYLASQGVLLVGIDSINIDDMSPEAMGERPAHTTFLANGIHVVEHLTNLSELPPGGALFTAVPPKFEGTGTFTVRAFAKIPA
ncbi:MAG: cyclase family protein [bacterium]|nr:cyclase family protein [bacterium]